MAETPMEGAPTVASPAETPPPSTSGYSGGPLLLRDRYHIHPERPLPELSTPSASAYAVDDRRDFGRQLFGLVCTPGLPPRTSVAAVVRGNRVRNLLPLVEYDVVDWPPLGQRCMVFVYERPLGGRLLDTVAKAGGRIPEHDLQNRIIEPLANALAEMANSDEAHRAVRPDNIFFLDPEHQTLVLGDCLTAPPGFDQPTVFETIERSMAGPAGRGQGEATDDLYALGVTLVFLLLGENPVSRMSEEELIFSKIERGTYASLCSGGRIPMSLLEPLRGLLSDEADERWTIQDLNLWIDGRRMTPMQKRAAAKPEARFIFAGHDHMTPRSLAYSFSRNVADAARVLKEGQADPWLRRSLSTPGLADTIARTVEMALIHEGEPAGSDDQLIAEVCMILDPKAPIRFKGYAFMPESFGTSLAVELLRQGNTKIGSEIIDRNIAGKWFEYRGGGGGGAIVALEKRFAALREFLTNRDPGYGIERCLYELNPSLPCQSSLIIQDYVVSIDELLPTLDLVANRIDTKTPPIDRHVAAFIAARLDQDVDNHLRALGDSHESKKTEGILSLLSLVQWRLGPDALYGLASWVGGLLGPAINSYHSRTVRRDIEREIPRLVRQGSLTDLYDLIDNAEQRQQDEQGYQAAIDEFILAETEIQDIESSDSARAESAERIGQQAAAMTSVIVTLVFVTILLLNEIW